MKFISLAALFAFSVSVHAADFCKEVTPNGVIDTDLESKMLLKREVLELQVKIAELEIEIAKLKRSQIMNTIALEGTEKEQ